MRILDKTVLLLCVACFASCGNEASPIAMRTQSIDGVMSPETLGYQIARYHQNANLYMIHGTTQCSATLVADRVVITASHCMVSNPMEWFEGKADPVMVDPEEILLLVTEKGKKLCTLEVQRYTVDPKTKLELETLGIIAHDIAVLILAEPTTSTCDDVLPIPLAPLSALSVQPGDPILASGFGSGVVGFWPRQWAKIAVETIGFDNLVAKDTGNGFFKHGDSGGGNFVETAPGVLGLIAVSSTVVPPYASLTNIGMMSTYLNQAIPSELLECSKQLASGVCRGSELFGCQDGLYSAVDCADSGQRCLSEEGAARCADLEPPKPPDAGLLPPDAGEGTAVDAAPSDVSLPDAPLHADQPSSSGCSLGVDSSPLSPATWLLLLGLALLWPRRRACNTGSGGEEGVRQSEP